MEDRRSSRPSSIDPIFFGWVDKTWQKNPEKTNTRRDECTLEETIPRRREKRNHIGETPVMMSAKMLQRQIKRGKRRRNVAQKGSPNRNSYRTYKVGGKVQMSRSAIGSRHSRTFYQGLDGRPSRSTRDFSIHTGTHRDSVCVGTHHFERKSHLQPVKSNAEL